MLLFACSAAFQAARFSLEATASWRKERRLQRKAKKYCARLPEFVKRFRRQMAGEHGTMAKVFSGNILTQDEQVRPTRFDIIKAEYLIRLMAEALDARLAKPLRSRADLVHALGTLDTLVDGILTLYREQWRPFLEIHKGHLQNGVWVQMQKAWGEMENFTREYINYRVLSDKDKELTDAVGGRHFEIPDALP